jgi:hypothetical protein
MENNQIVMTDVTFKKLVIAAVAKFRQSGSISMRDVFGERAGELVTGHDYDTLFDVPIKFYPSTEKTDEPAQEMEIEAAMFYSVFKNRLGAPKIVSARVRDDGCHLVSCLLAAKEMRELLTHEGCGQAIIGLLRLP